MKLLGETGPDTTIDFISAAKVSVNVLTYKYRLESGIAKG
jgi:hypothetical protein